MTRGSVANWQKWSGNRAKLEHFMGSFFSYFPLLFCCFMGSRLVVKAFVIALLSMQGCLMMFLPQPNHSQGVHERDIIISL